MSGTSPTDPHGSQNPYGTDPYGAAPQGPTPGSSDPAGASPYGQDPYGAPPAAPYGAPGHLVAELREPELRQAAVEDTIGVVDFSVADQVDGGERLHGASLAEADRWPRR